MTYKCIKKKNAFRVVVSGVVPVGELSRTIEYAPSTESYGCVQSWLQWFHTSRFQPSKQLKTIAPGQKNSLYLLCRTYVCSCTVVLKLTNLESLYDVLSHKDSSNSKLTATGITSSPREASRGVISKVTMRDDRGGILTTLGLATICTADATPFDGESSTSAYNIQTHFHGLFVVIF